MGKHLRQLRSKAAVRSIRKVLILGTIVMRTVRTLKPSGTPGDTSVWKPAPDTPAMTKLRTVAAPLARSWSILPRRASVPSRPPSFHSAISRFMPSSMRVITSGLFAGVYWPRVPGAGSEMGPGPLGRPSSGPENRPSDCQRLGDYVCDVGLHLFRASRVPYTEAIRG